MSDPATDEVVAQAVSSANEGRYAFEFTGIAPGLYNVFAGSDVDNDLLICDAGEACGAWLTTDQPILIELESDIQDIDFPVEYLVAIPTTASTARPEGSNGQGLPRRKISK